METIEQKVKDALKRQFTEDEIEFDHFDLEPVEQIYGNIISEKFEGLDAEARHEMIWNLLRTYLAPEDRRQVLSFLAYTPAEVEFYNKAFEGPPPEKLPLEAMKALEQKIKNVLKLQFTDEEIRFDDDPGERFSGFIVSEKFLDMDDEARHEMIWKLLRDHLAPEERRQVAILLPFTPQEYRAYSKAHEYAY